jgi:hypothetical protein
MLADGVHSDHSSHTLIDICCPFVQYGQSNVAAVMRTGKPLPACQNCVATLMQIGELELLVPPPPSSAAVVAFALKFLAGYGNTLLSSSSSSSYAAGSASQDMAAGSSSSSRVGPDGQPLASFGIDAARDGGLGMQRLVSMEAVDGHMCY